ncbi:MAG TPA: hypothetical protein VMB19_15345 [Silvibacterium sp.]|nr:hypothetical protein [Silvibacterium sp.]
MKHALGIAGPDGKTEFQKNIEAITTELGEIPADSRVVVIGITDQSFAQPDILLSATIPADAGYFGERLAAAQTLLVRTWKSRSAKLEPTYRQTDIIGALLIASQIFEAASSGQKVLIIYSDMRHRTPGLNMESERHDPDSGWRKLFQVSVIPNLSDVKVNILGVDGAGKSMQYWQGLRRLWTDFLRASGAEVREFSPLRGLQGAEMPCSP